MRVAAFYLGHPMINPCVIIPVYNHEQAITTLVNAIMSYNLPCILVDDGSSSSCAHVLDQLATVLPNHITLLRHAQNRGKGSAVTTGLQYALTSGYSHALQIDADGQHCTADIPRFLQLAAEHPHAVITGYPQYDASVPKIRLYARYLTHLWVWINTLSRTIKDAMCGFRIYPLATVTSLLQHENLSKRMDFDIDILVRLYWEGLEIINVPTHVSYPTDGVSHFRLAIDNILISKLHAKLFFGMLLRSPKLLARKFHKNHWAKINEFSFIGGMRLLFWIFRVFGRWPFRLTLYPVLIWYLIINPSAYAASNNYLKHLNKFNPGIKPNLLNTIRHSSAFAEGILDKMLLWGGLFKFDNARYYGQDYIRTNIAQQRGGLFICSHLGNLELCRVLAKYRNGLKLTILIHTKHAKLFNQLLAQLDPSSQLNLMQVTEISPAIAMQLIAKIARGEFIAIAGDRIPVTPNPRVTWAAFLGQNAPFPIGPYVLASLLQCPAYLLFALHTKAGVELHVELFRESILLPRKNREQLLAELAADYAKRLEYYCMQTPLQWFNFYDFWSLPTR